MRLAFEDDEMAHLAAGWPSGQRMHLKIEGDVAHGLRLCLVHRDGFALQQSEHIHWLNLAASSVGAITASISPVEIATVAERGDDGPILLTPPFPLPFIPPELRGAARAAQQQHRSRFARAEAESLFKGAAKTSGRTGTVAWAVAFVGTGETRMRSAVARCSCGATAQVSLAHMLPDDVISKKFVEQGWKLRRKTASCPDCQKKPKPDKKPSVLPPPENLAEAIDRKVQGKAGDLKAAIALVNELLDEMNDPSLLLRVVKGRLDVKRLQDI
jgi:hypothetical protein